MTTTHTVGCGFEQDPASVDWGSVAAMSRRVAVQSVSVQDAEDLSQDLAFHLWQVGLQNITTPDGYVRTAAKNAVNNHLRKKRRSPEVPLAPAHEPSLPSRDEQIAMAKDEVAWLLSQLDSNVERAFLQQRLDNFDLTWEEFGAAIGKPAGTAAQQWYRLRAKIVAKLSDRDEAGAARNGASPVACNQRTPRLGFVGDVFEQHTGNADMDWAQ